MLIMADSWQIKRVKGHKSNEMWTDGRTPGRPGS